MIINVECLTWCKWTDILKWLCLEYRYLWHENSRLVNQMNWVNYSHFKMIPWYFKVFFVSAFKLVRIFEHLNMIWFNMMYLFRPTSSIRSSILIFQVKIRFSSIKFHIGWYKSPLKIWGHILEIYYISLISKEEILLFLLSFFLVKRKETSWLVNFFIVWINMLYPVYTLSSIS